MVKPTYSENKEQPFIIELKRIIEDPKKIELYKEIIQWRKVAQTQRSLKVNPPKDGTIIRQISPPPHVKPFLTRSDFHADQSIIAKIISGAIIPSQEGVLSITQNYGMLANAQETQDFIKLGDEYIAWCENYTPPNKQNTTHTIEKIQSRTESNNCSALKAEILKLLETRIELPGAKIVAIDSPEAKKLSKLPKPISFNSVYLIANVDKITTARILKDDTRLNDGQYDRIILPILHALNATPEEITTVTDAFLAQQDRNDPKKRTEQTQKTGSMSL